MFNIYHVFTKVTIAFLERLALREVSRLNYFKGNTLALWH